MPDIFNQDFQELIQCLNKQKVEYLLVGGYSVIIYGYPRTTGDLDLWINPTEDNYKNFIKACHDFGLPLSEMPKEKFLDTVRYDVFSFGTPPVAVDFMTKCKGLEFNKAYAKRKVHQVDNVEVSLIHINDLILAKESSGRAKDLDDLEKLNRL